MSEEIDKAKQEVLKAQQEELLRRFKERAAQEKQEGKKEEPVKLPALPVKGYSPQDPVAVALVNEGKILEEYCLRYLAKVNMYNMSKRGTEPPTDSLVRQHWLILGENHITGGFMWTFRSVFKPSRLELPEDKMGSAPIVGGEGTEKA